MCLPRVSLIPPRAAHGVYQAIEKLRLPFADFPARLQANSLNRVVTSHATAKAALDLADRLAHAFSLETKFPIEAIRPAKPMRKTIPYASKIEPQASKWLIAALGRWT